MATETFQMEIAAVLGQKKKEGKKTGPELFQKNAASVAQLFQGQEMKEREE